MPALLPLADRRWSRLRVPPAASAVGIALALLCGCAGAGTQPNVASNATLVPGAATNPGQASVGALSVNVASIEREGSKLVIMARIQNSGPTPDELLQVGSQVSPSVSLAPPLPVPAHASVELGSAGKRTVLPVQGRLEPGGTIDLILQFRHAGELQVYSPFSEAKTSS